MITKESREPSLLGEPVVGSDSVVRIFRQTHGIQQIARIFEGAHEFEKLTASDLELGANFRIQSNRWCGGQLLGCQPGRQCSLLLDLVRRCATYLYHLNHGQGNRVVEHGAWSSLPGETPTSDRAL